jgi:hypothetical protein|uniref:Uncharacterized protein n=1 Tax=viral metagenome TaxID=1070528 RepID=A0A6C0HFS8_9ZZZZ
MKRRILYFGTIFLTVVIFTIFLTTRENFVIGNHDRVLEAIEYVKLGFRNIEEAMKKKEKNEPVCPPNTIYSKQLRDVDIKPSSDEKVVGANANRTIETLPISNIISVNLQHLDSLAATYIAMDEYEQDPVSSLNTIQKELNAYIDIYTYINDRYKLALPAIPKNTLLIRSAQSSCKEFQRKLSLPRAQLYSQLKYDILHKVPTQVVATMPMISSLEPPPELIRSELKNKKYSDKIHTYPRIDIFPRLKNVYRCTNNVVKNKKIEEPPIKDIYTQLEKTYSNSSMHSNF